VFDAYVDSRDDAEFVERIEQLGDQLAGARVEYLSDRERIDALVEG
jgi:hypothetical protein